MSYKIKDNICTIPVKITIDENFDKENFQEYILQLITESNDYFNSSTTNVKININKKETVTVDINQDESSTNAHTITKALKLVREYGTIIIKTDITNEDFVIDKKITITGPATINSLKIQNNALGASIRELTFIDCNIINNNKIIVDSCTFKDGKDSIITNNGNADISNCTFTTNNAQYGACINITNTSRGTIVNKCMFNQNNAQYYGGCVYSNKGNDIEITESVFYGQNYANNNGSCISIYGNAYISHNTFYNNIGNNEIYLMNGSIEMDNNIFDGNITSIKKLHGDIDAGLNYWGYNTLEDIQQYSGIEDVDSYLISRCELVRKDENSYYAVGVIDQYKNRLEIETTTIETIDSPLPVSVGMAESLLNKQEIIVSNDFVMKIGKANIEVVL